MKGRGTRPAKTRLLIVEKECLEDLCWWVETNRKTALRILDLIDAIIRDPFEGIGKPEPLKHLGSSGWSRRISAEDRLVYLVSDDRAHLLQARYHY